MASQRLAVLFTYFTDSKELYITVFNVNVFIVFGNIIFVVCNNIKDGIEN